MTFCNKGMLSPRYIAPYKVLHLVGNVAYKLMLPNNLASIHPVFHVSMLNKCLVDPTSILPVEGLGVYENLFMNRI